MKKTMRSVQFAAGLLATALTHITPARAEAWGASWGLVQGYVSPRGADSRVVWNTDPTRWLVHAEAEVKHYHPAYSFAHQVDTEAADPNSDGVVTVGPVATADLASVNHVQAGVGGGGYVNINSIEDVYSYAHDIPSSSSFASGLGQHDNTFEVQYTGTGTPPDTTPLVVSLIGPWNLSGYSDPDDNWFADTFAYVEVYAALTGVSVASTSEYHYLSGPGGASASGTFNLQFQIDASYNTEYALRFYLDDESWAIAQDVPEPGPLALLGLGLFVTLRRRRN